jgi:(heptosyl)LPS beta-1,4-glucosyltransferase
VGIAKKFGAKVFMHDPMGYVEPARNFALSLASSDWILILDADEKIPQTLSSKIKKIINNSDSADYYAVPRKNVIFGKWMKHSRWWPDYNIRLFKKGKVEWENTIHSIPRTQGDGNDLPHKEKYAIIHNNYSSIDQFVSRMNRYTTIQANTLSSEGYKFHWDDIIKKPFSEFFSRYFSGQGYKDGLHGLALALLQSFSELVLYLKLWQLNKCEEK